MVELSVDNYKKSYIILIVFACTQISPIRAIEKSVCGKINAKNISSIISNKYTKDENQIIGQGQWPWQAIIYEYDYGYWKNICFGTIISPHIVITAAGCFYDAAKVKSKERSLFKVFIGRLSEIKADDSSKEFQISSIHLHEDYLGVTTDYDCNIALIGLSSDIQFNDIVKPVCLDLDGTEKSANSSLAMIATWDGIRQVKNDRKLNLKIVNYLSRKYCIKSNQGSIFIKYLSFDQFCLISEDGRTDEDMGTGVVVKSGEIFYLKGILGFNVGSDFLIATSISTYQFWIKSITAIIDTEKRCIDGDGFLCADKCVEAIKKCDGVLDCDDGSDESEITCGNYLKNETCILPDQIGGASYRLLICDGNDKKCSRNPLQSLFLYTKIRVICNDGYAVPVDKTDFAMCTPDGWFPETPQCKKLCKPLQGENLAINCIFEGASVKCDKYTNPGTIASFNCKTHFKMVEPLKYTGNSTCSPSGEWIGPVPRCTPECGFVHKYPEAEPLSASSAMVEEEKGVHYGKYPWNVGLYELKDKKSMTDYTYICGGFIITPNVIITAAHCIKRPDYNNFDKELHMIGAGKLSSFANISEPYEQYRKIKKVTFAEIYTDFDEHDIVLIDVKKPFNINNFVSPVCIDWDKNWIPPGTFGRIASWGYNYIDGSRYDRLQEIDLPIIGLLECRQKYPQVIQYLSYDKFCALNKNGTIRPRQGSSGSAMTFRRGDIHYAYGLISTQAGNEALALTNITKHLDLIRDHFKTA